MTRKSNGLSVVFAGYIVLIFVLTGLTFLQKRDEPLNWIGADLRTKPKIEHLIEERLRAGAPSTEIEKLFADLNISYSYHSGRLRSDGSLGLPYYSGMIRNVAHNPYIIQKVRIRIYVNESKSFVDAEVSNLYTTW